MAEKGAKIRVHDPAGMPGTKEIFPEYTYAANAYEACEGADVVVLFTEWNQYRALDLAELKAKMNDPVFVDLRNVYSRRKWPRLVLTIIRWEDPNRE